MHGLPFEDSFQLGRRLACVAGKRLPIEFDAMNLTKLLVAALALSTLALPARATNQGALPEGAIALTPAETASLYVGHTTKFDAPDAVVRNTWKPGGKAFAIWEGKNGHVSPADGTWNVSGNQFCYDLDYYSIDTGKPVHHESLCRQWWKVGKALWVKNVSGDEYKYSGDIYEGHYVNLSKDDQVSAKYAKFKKMPPRD
jgi:Protein of unknown function (DUF995)